MAISRQLLYWLIATSKGGLTRLKIIRLLKETPMNVQQISAKTGLHYTTAQHHIEVLVKHGLVVGTGDSYGKAYFISQDLEEAYHELEKITSKISR